jgi:hypothetical protein
VNSESFSEERYGRESSREEGYGRGRDVEPHRGTLLLILGILGIVVCGPLAIAAWVMGSNDLTAIRAGRMDREGEGMTNAGYILGIIGTILFVLQLIVVCLWFAAAGFLFGRVAPDQAPPRPVKQEGLRRTLTEEQNSRASASGLGQHGQC